MDKDRLIRFQIPPFMLLAMLLWGVYLTRDSNPLVQAALNPHEDGSLKLLISALGVIGVSILPAGYFIGVLTIALLSWWPLNRLFPNGHRYDLAVSSHATRMIWNVLGADRSEKHDLEAVAVFDQACLNKGVHEWLLRRWNAFNVATQCVTSLTLSILISGLLKMPLLSWQMAWWWVAIIALVPVFIWQSVTTWKETRMMYDVAVQSTRAQHSDPYEREKARRKED